VVVDRNAAALVERQIQPAKARMWCDPRGPDQGAGWERLPAGEAGAVGGHLLERRLEANVDAAAAQLAQRIIGEADVDLGKDAAGRLYQHPAHAVQTRTGIALHRVGGEVLELGKRLQPAISTADEDVGEQLVAARRI